MRLADFASHPQSLTANLTLAETAALRLYTTAAFKSINDPLRDFERLARKEKHPFALTVVLIAEAVLKLRAVGAQGPEAHKKVLLYRGMRNVDLPERFYEEGGSEVSHTSRTGLLLGVSATLRSMLLVLSPIRSSSP